MDPVVRDVAPSPEGIRRRKRAAENCGGEADIDDDEVDAEIADLQRQLDEAKRKKKRKKGSPKKRQPLHPQFVEDNLVGLDGKHARRGECVACYLKPASATWTLIYGWPALPPNAALDDTAGNEPSLAATSWTRLSVVNPPHSGPCRRTARTTAQNPSPGPGRF